MNYLKVKKMTNDDVAFGIEDRNSWINEAICKKNYGISDIVGGYVVIGKKNGNLIEKENVKGRIKKIDLVQYLGGRIFRGGIEAITNNQGTWVEESKLR